MPEEIPPGEPPEDAPEITDVEATADAAEKASESVDKAAGSVDKYKKALNGLTKLIAEQTDAAIALDNARGKNIDSMERAASILANQTAAFSKLMEIMNKHGAETTKYFDDQLQRLRDNEGAYRDMAAEEKAAREAELMHMKEIFEASKDNTDALKKEIATQGVRAQFFTEEAASWKKQRGTLLQLIGLGKTFSDTYTGTLVGSITPLGVGIINMGKTFGFIKDESREASEATIRHNKDMVDELTGSMSALEDAAKDAKVTPTVACAADELEECMEEAAEAGDEIKDLGDKLKDLDGTGVGDIAKGLGKTADAAASVPGMFTRIIAGLRGITEVLGGAIMGRLEEMIAGVDRTVSGFMKATGATDEYKDAVYGSVEALRQQGLDMTTAGAAAGALMQNTTLLRGATEKARTEMISFVATMEQAGVSSDISSKSLHVMNKVMGITGPALRKEFEGMVHMAQDMGMSVSAVSQDFVEASKILAAHGPKMAGVFRALAGQAASTGISMSRLLEIAAQFDTFEGAADAVGRLNGILGGPYLNSIDMVYKTESQRNRAILESVRLSGLSFEAMGRFEKKALAAAVGITDMAEAAAFFGTSLEAFDRAETKALENADAQKAMAKMAKDATGIFQNLQNTLNQFVVNSKPFIEFLRKVIGGLGYVLSNVGGIITVITILSITIATKLAAAMFGLIAQMAALQISGGMIFAIIFGITLAIGALVAVLYNIENPMDKYVAQMEQAADAAKEAKAALGSTTIPAMPQTPAERQAGTFVVQAPVTDALVTEEGKVIPIDSKDRPYALGKPGGPVEAAVSSPGRPAAKEAAIPVHTATAIHNLVTNVNNNAKIAAQSAAAPQAARATQDTRPVVITVDGALLTRGVMTYVDGVKKARFLEGLPE